MSYAIFATLGTATSLLGWIPSLTGISNVTFLFSTFCLSWLLLRFLGQVDC